MVVISIKKLEVSNFKNFETFETSFNGLQLITGPNGSGKSSIFESIYVALYGRRPNGKPAKSVIRTGNTSASITLEIQVDNDIYHVQRIIGYKSSFLVSLNHETVSTSASKTKEIVENLIPQEIVKLSMLQTLDIKKLILDVIDIDSLVTKIKQYHDSILEKYSTLESEYTIYKSKKEELQSIINDKVHKLNLMYQEIEDTKKEIESVKSILEGKDIDKIHEIKSLKSRINEEIDSYIQSLVSSYNKELLDLDKEILQLNSEIANKQLEIDRLNQEYITKLNEYKDELHKKHESNVSDIYNEISKLESDKNTLYGNLSYIQAQINELESIIHLDSDTCPTCKQHIHEDHISSIKVSLKDKQAKFMEISKQIEEIDSKIEFLNNQIKDLESKLESSIIEYEKKLKEKYDTLVSSINNEISQLNAKLQDLYNKKNDINKQIEITIENIDTNKVLSNILDKYKIDKNLYDQVEYYIELYQKQIHLDSKLSTLISQYNSEYNSYIDLTNKLKELDTTKIESDLKLYKDRLDIVSDLSNTRLWKKLALMHLKDSINTYISQSNIEDLVKVELDIDDNENIQVYVENMNGNIVTLDDTSQGESVIATLVLYNALRKIASRHIQFNMLFLDEVIDRLDQENIEKVVSYLKKEVDESNSNILVITHNTYAQELDVWDSIIELSRT